MGSGVDLSPEWKSVHTDYGIGTTSTPRVEIERVDLTNSPGGRVQAPRVMEVEIVNPEVTEYLTRKRNRKQSRNDEGTTTDWSGESNSRGTVRGGKKKKGKTDIGQADKRRINELEEENKKLKERLADEELEDEYQTDYSLLPNKKNLPSVEELREEIRFEPHYAIEGIIVDCANRISKIANCSNNIRGGLVRDLRICARKVQAGSLQMSAIIREAKGDNTERIPQEVKSRMEELERENVGLKKCIEELKEQVQVLRQMYSNEDFEDGKKIKNMEKEISILKEEKERMRKELEEMKTEKSRKE